jgi:hypothetical protein
MLQSIEFRQYTQNEFQNLKYPFMHSKIYATKLIPLDSYSKELSNGIILVAYTSYFVILLFKNILLTN